MSPKPWGNQTRLIESMEGVYLVDAGAGTGKTFTITRRYAHLLENGVSPEDIYLATFTENAAENMKEEIINYCDYDVTELRDAPISTFHGFCQRLILSHGFDVPSKLGIDGQITANTKTISNEVREVEEFRSFYDRFVDGHPEYSDFYPVIYDESELLGLMKSLGAKGIFPTKTGWYRGGKELLLGDEARFRAELGQVNQPISGENGPRYSRLLTKLGSMRNKTFLQEKVTDKNDLKLGKQVDPQVMLNAFHEDRERLIQFVHDLYFEYIKYALGRNYINFSFQLMFAFVLLMEEDELRRSTQFDYVMVDEFQDTNELQFKLSLLLSKTGNIAVVGDWKQSIYGFQYASVQNITDFYERISRYHREINEEKKRVSYAIEEIQEIELRNNFRSSQTILDFSEGALKVRGKKREQVGLDREVVSLTAQKDRVNTEVKGFVSEDEIEAILEKLVQVVHSKEYQIDGRPLKYSDVAILSRNRSFAEQLTRKARKSGVPVSYEGGAEIFKTDPSILLLAWLRILVREDSTRGWAVVLDDIGYNMEEVKQIIKSRDYPPDTLEFKERLESAHDIGQMARTVFNRYGFDNPFTDAIVECLHETFDSAYLNLGDIVNFIEENIRSSGTYEVDSARPEAATVQTIHAAKGLEYPAVFLANVNQSNFPSTNAGGKRIFYDDVLGLRQRKVYSRKENFPFDNLSSYLVSKVRGINYDEERRLLYVAMTRAKSYLYLFAEKGRESRFFKDLDLPVEEITPELGEVTPPKVSSNQLEARSPGSKRPIKKAVHSVIDLSSLEEPRDGRGTDFGRKMHGYAESVARGQHENPPEEDDGSEDRRNIYHYIQSLDGKLLPEQDVLIPRYEEGDKYVYHGSIDLLHVKEDRVEVIDFKTDLDRSLQDQYVTQVGLYKKAAESEYPDREVVGVIFYTATGKVVELD